MKKYIHLAEIGSTNAFLANYVPERNEQITVVFTDYQTAGRGQGTNKWESARGENLLFSIMIHPVNVQAKNQFLLSMAGALGIRDALMKRMSGIRLKWPNDVYHQGRKLSGTLIETTLKGRKIQNCILGVGLNVNQTVFSKSLPNPTSIHRIIGSAEHPNIWLQRVVDAMTLRFEQLENGDVESIVADYHKALFRRRRRARYRLSDGSVVAATLIEVQPSGHARFRLHLPEGDKEQLFGFKEIEYIL